MHSDRDELQHPGIFGRAVHQHHGLVSPEGRGDMRCAWGQRPLFFMAVGISVQSHSELLPVIQSWAQPMPPFPKQQSSKCPNEVAFSQKRSQISETKRIHTAFLAVTISPGLAVFIYAGDILHLAGLSFPDPPVSRKEEVTRVPEHFLLLSPLRFRITQLL